MCFWAEMRFGTPPQEISTHLNWWIGTAKASPCHATPLRRTILSAIPTLRRQSHHAGNLMHYDISQHKRCKMLLGWHLLDGTEYCTQMNHVVVLRGRSHFTLNVVQNVVYKLVNELRLSGWSKRAVLETSACPPITIVSDSEIYTRNRAQISVCVMKAF